MVKIVKLIVIFLVLLLLVAIFFPGCNNSKSIAADVNLMDSAPNSDLSNIKTSSKGNNIFVENIDCKEQLAKFNNDLRLQYYKNSESSSN
ncbi:MAG: hypothetical protein ACYCXK_01285 [Candidatus Humimicrobiaceae bacterium]